MQIGNTKYSVGTGSWKDRTPVLLKFICDLLLLFSAITANLPAIKNPEISIWILTGGVIAKLLSNFISEHMPQQVQEVIANDTDSNTDVKI